MIALLEDHVDGLLPVPQSEEIRDHLDVCADCRETSLSGCSVFEPATLSGRSAGYDAIGGMHNHTAELSRHLDKMGAVQLVLTSRLDGPAGTGRSCGPGWTRGWPGRHGRSWPPRWHSAAPRLTSIRRVRGTTPTSTERR